jgi:hypothetical protein
MNEQAVPGEIAPANSEPNEARKRWRLILLAALAANIGAFALNSTALGILAYAAAAVAAGSFAVASGRARSTALVGSLLLPVIGPLIVVALPDRKGSNPGVVVLSRLMRQVGLFSGSAGVEGDQLVLKSSFGFSRRTFDLAGLRLLYAIIPGRFKWRVTSSSQAMQYVSLDLFDDEKFTALNDMLIEAVRSKATGGIQLVVGDYQGEAALIDLSRLHRDPGLLEAIARTRRQRLEKLRRWLAASPKVLMQKYTLTAAGIEQGKWLKEWEKIETFQTLTTNGMFTTLTIVLKEAKAGRFTGKMRNLTETLFSFAPSRKEWYSAELFFWVRFADDRKVLGQG